MKTLVKPKFCTSTHGGSGYAVGSYLDGKDIICGMCGIRIKNPRPMGYDAKGRPMFGSHVRDKKDIICDGGMEQPN